MIENNNETKNRLQASCVTEQKTDHSLTVGPRGPVLLEDMVLHETLEHFVHEKIIERAVHTKGYGAFGYFTTYQSMSPYTKAGFLQTPGQRISTFSRFSLAVSNKGTPDTSRNVRGFSTKFYTNEGNFDLLCNHIPVFLIRDSIKFPAAINSLSPSPVNNLMNPISFWSFVAENPESMHFLTWLYSDAGTASSLRRLRTYGVNTYVWKNAEGVKRFVKYHWIPLDGEEMITRQESVLLAGENPDIAGDELYQTIASGKAAEYDLYVQLMDMGDENTLPFDPLDDTKTWSETQYPLMHVGRLTLNKNTENYKGQVEKSAFSPSNLVEGIELSDDKMLQGRSFIYWDAQRRRLGPDFRDIPINHTSDWSKKNLVTSGEGNFAEGIIKRSSLPQTDDFTQAGQHYMAIGEVQREHLVDNIAFELYSVPTNIQQCVLRYLFNVNPEFGQNVTSRMQWYQNQKQIQR